MGLLWSASRGFISRHNSCAITGLPAPEGGIGRAMRHDVKCNVALIRYGIAVFCQPWLHQLPQRLCYPWLFCFRRGDRAGNEA
eukprot:1160869-Pelagomonas_calceolata.AAC.7